MPNSPTTESKPIHKVVILTAWLYWTFTLVNSENLFSFVCWLLLTSLIWEVWNKPQLNLLNRPAGKRALTYLALILAALCLKLPTAWGFTHSPAPWIKYNLSALLYLTILLRGVQTFDHFHKTVTHARIAFSINLFLAVCVLGKSIVALTLQMTSAHFQWVDQTQYILVSLGILLLFQIQEFRNTRKLKKQNSNE